MGFETLHNENRFFKENRVAVPSGKVVTWKANDKRSIEPLDGTELQQVPQEIYYPKVDGPFWNPSYIQTEWWLDASDASTITVSGGTVEEFADKSGNGYDMMNTSADRYPDTGVTSVNGLNTIYFDNLDGPPNWDPDNLRWLQMESGPQNDSDAISIAVFKSNILGIIDPNVGNQLDNPVDRIFSFQEGGSTRWSLQIATDDGLTGYIRYAQSDRYTFATSSNTFTTGGPHIASGYRNGSAFYAGLDGAYGEPNLLGADDTDVSRWVLGGYARNAYPSGPIADRCDQMELAELIIVKEYSLELLQKLEGYLAHKWGTAASLPDNHPYKSYAPGVSV